MGHHYVPQRYLRQFEVEGHPGSIWQHEKAAGEQKRIPIKVAAQVSGYYHPDVEKHLGSEIEPRGSEAIERLLRYRRITARERADLALYLGVMLKRVPAHRRRANEMFPGIMNKVMKDFRDQVRENLQAEAVHVARLLSEFDRIERQYEEKPPPCIRDQIREPYPTRRVVDAIFSMQWRVFVPTGSRFFLTSDNPFFFTRGCGLGNPQSEFILPLSPKHMLHGSRVHDRSEIPFVKVPESVVRQANRRMAHDAESVIFSHTTCDWLPKVLALREEGGYIPNWTPKRLV